MNTHQPDLTLSDPLATLFVDGQPKADGRVYCEPEKGYGTFRPNDQILLGTYPEAVLKMEGNTKELSVRDFRWCQDTDHWHFYFDVQVP